MWQWCTSRSTAATVIELLGEDLFPGREWLVGRDQQGAPLIAMADEIKQDAALLLISAHIANVINHQQRPTT
jgi:hypothetical protein